MESLQQKLWRSGQALKSYAFQKDENGMAELTPKAAAISIIIVAVIFLAVSAWAG